ncbi:QueT transporter family protein [Anaeromicropila populeti]|uniref:Uncharacterized membrane protein n=1 Tax=Anaeromicropila populeti TaxID=37658 RepID=A0A1I6IXF6_9FIRM|nr:QueT transporter family protein [Anaeromicropila populeti]SFR71432.1 Uncharacterized membrane protein [Anaeromicropila populeti]
MKNKSILFLTQAAMIAALYVVLTYVSSMLGLANFAIQLRLSEALTILPFFTAAAIPGVSVGCLLANIVTGCSLLDIIFGTLATLIGAICSYALRRNKFLVPLPPIAANTIIVPWILRISYGIPDAIPFLMLTVGIGEILSCGVLGLLLLLSLQKHKAVFSLS